ncbi:MAG: hypothetical protein IJ668_10630 [Selenomonadaceae bacterium]|nr:hypothetical protein [Selenomonadaceae bacterium]
MGFFSFLGDVVKAVGAAVVTTIAAPAALAIGAAKKIGLISDPKPAERTNYVSEQVGRAESLSASSTVQQVENISNLLRQYHDQYCPDGRALEQHFRKEIKKYFEALIDQIENNEELSNAFGLESIRRKQERLLRRIDGSITDAISTRISLDDYECRRILEMPKGDSRTRRMKNFVQNVIDDAKEDLIKAISAGLYEQTDAIAEFLEDRLDDKEREARKAKTEFDRWEREINSNTFDKEREQIPARVKLYAIERAEGIINTKIQKAA